MCRLRSSDGDINGANTITFEKKLLGGERREQERAAKSWSTGGNLIISPLCAEHPPWMDLPQAAGYCCVREKSAGGSERKGMGMFPA